MSTLPLTATSVGGGGGGMHQEAPPPPPLPSPRTESCAHSSVAQRAVCPTLHTPWVSLLLLGKMPKGFICPNCRSATQKFYFLNPLLANNKPLLKMFHFLGLLANKKMPQQPSLPGSNKRPVANAGDRVGSNNHTASSHLALCS